MSFAFQISADDVGIVLGNAGEPWNEKRNEALFDRLDCDQVEQAALQATDMDDQTELAQAEILRQLIVLGEVEDKSAPAP